MWEDNRLWNCVAGVFGRLKTQRIDHLPSAHPPIRVGWDGEGTLESEREAVVEGKSDCWLESAAKRSRDICAFSGPPADGLPKIDRKYCILASLGLLSGPSVPSTENESYLADRARHKKKREKQFRRPGCIQPTPICDDKARRNLIVCCRT